MEFAKLAFDAADNPMTIALNQGIVGAIGYVQLIAERKDLIQ
jgi:hypothetical protein